MDDYDKVDTEPIGTPAETFYAAVDVLTIQQVCSGCLQHTPVHCWSKSGAWPA